VAKETARILEYNRARRANQDGLALIADIGDDGTA
jgi:hypothetical protein